MAAAYVIGGVAAGFATAGGITWVGFRRGYLVFPTLGLALVAGATVATLIAQATPAAG